MNVWGSDSGHHLVKTDMKVCAFNLKSNSTIFLHRDKEKDLQYVKNYQPENTDVKHLRILLYGPVGAGKSSFINSVASTVGGKMCIPAGVSATVSDRSHTKKVRKLAQNKPSSSSTNSSSPPFSLIWFFWHTFRIFASSPPGITISDVTLNTLSTFQSKSIAARFFNVSFTKNHVTTSDETSFHQEVLCWFWILCFSICHSI